MAKVAFQNATRGNIFLFDPDDVTLIEDPKHPLYQDRVRLPVSEALVLSMMAKGFRTTITVRKDGDKALVVDGRQRVKAAREANRRLKSEGKETLKVRANQEKGEDSDIFGVMVLSNKGAQRDDAMSEAREIKRFLDFGKSHEEAAAIFCVPVSRVKQLLVLLSDLAPQVQKAVAEGMSVSAAVKLAKLPREEQVKKLAEVQAVEGKPTAAKMTRAMKPKGETSPPTKKQIRAVFEKRPDSNIGQVLEWVLTGKCADPKIMAALQP